MRYIILTFFSFWLCIFNSKGDELRNFYPADHGFIQYTGRIDFSDPTKPKIWASGAYVEVKFNGTFCTLQINDELLWGKIHNYIEIKIDNLPAYRIQLKEKENTIVLAQNLTKGEHTILICKNTEFENGYVEIVGFTAEKLLKPHKKQKRKIKK